VKARGANTRGAAQRIDLQPRIIGHYADHLISATSHKAVKGPCFDARVIEVGFRGFIRIESQAQCPWREKFDIGRLKLGENLSKLLQLVTVVRRNKNRVFLRRHWKREV